MWRLMESLALVKGSAVANLLLFFLSTLPKRPSNDAMRSWFMKQNSLPNFTYSKMKRIRNASGVDACETCLKLHKSTLEVVQPSLS